MLASWFLLVLAAPCQEGAYAFQNGLERVRSLADGEQWSQAQQELELLLEEHREQVYVRRHLPELREAVTRIQFGATYAEPDLRELISGKVVKYDPAAELIRIRYRPEGQLRALRDFDDSSDVYVHPLFFVGDCSITLKGTSFDRETRLITSATTDRVLTAHIEPFNGTVALIFDEGGAYRKVLDHGEQRVLRKDKPYEIKLTSRGGEVVIACNRKPLLRAKGDPQPGRIGFAGVLPQEIVIEGKVTTEWFDGLRDGALEQARTRFQRDFDPATELPDWLLGMEEPPQIQLRFPYPDGGKRVHGEIWAKIDALTEEEKYGAARRMARGLDEEQTTEAFREFVWAYIEAANDHHEEALARLERIRELAPDFSGARVLEARVLRAQGSWRAALEILRQVTNEDPLEAEAWPLLIQIELGSGRPADAQASLARAVGAGIPAETLERVRRTLLRNLEGPKWEETFQYESKHYRVSSNLNPFVCEETAKPLEEALQLYKKDFPQLSPPSAAVKTSTVYVFAGQPGYLSYVAELERQKLERGDGMYFRDLGQLLLWNVAERDALLRTIRHEAFHPFLDAALPYAPPWLHEGLAEYYEVADPTRGLGQAGRPREDHLQLLLTQPADWTPLDSFLLMTPRQFQSKPAVHYAEAWGLVQFLMQAGPEERQRLDAYLAALAEGQSWSAAAGAFLEGRSAQAFRRELRAYLVGLRPAGR